MPTTKRANDISVDGFGYIDLHRMTAKQTEKFALKKLSRICIQVMAYVTLRVILT